jgi:hypothetical protein
MLQQNQLQNFLPYINPSLFLNQSLNLASQQLHFSVDPSAINRGSMHIPIEGGLNQSPINLSPIRNEPIVATGSPENTEKLSKHYDTANEQIPLPKPKKISQEDIQTRFEFDNENFNSKSNFPPSKNRKTGKDSIDDIPVGMTAGGDDHAQDAQIDYEPIQKKGKTKKKKDLERKKEFLKRRKKYDPRKAIEKEKKKKARKANKKPKSAFPKGFFKKGENEEIEEESSEKESEKSTSEKISDVEEEKQKKEVASKKEKEVKVKQESRSEKRKSRVVNKPSQRPPKQESDESSPERRLDSTPKRPVKTMPKKKTIESQRQSPSKKGSERSTIKSKGKNVQFQKNKTNWNNVQRRIDCWKDVPVPPQNKDPEDDEIEEETPPRIRDKSIQRKPVAIKNVNLIDEQVAATPEEFRLVESLNKQGEEIEILEMNEDEIPYKKVVVRKGDQDQYDIHVYEEGEDHHVEQNEEFSDDYDSAELSVPEERDADEYVYSEHKVNNEYDEYSGSANQQMQEEGSYVSSIQPLPIEELDNLYEEVHGDDRMQICSEPNFTSM